MASVCPQPGIDFLPPAGSEVSLLSKSGASGELRSGARGRGSGAKPLVVLLPESAAPQIQKGKLWLDAK